MDHCPAASEADAGYDLVIVGKDEFRLFLVPEGDEEVGQVSREQGGRVCGKRARQLHRTDDRNAVSHDRFTGHASFDIPSGFGSEVDDDAAEPHCRQLSIADQARRRPAGNQRGRDDDVLLGDMPGYELGLRSLILRTGLAGIAALPFAFDPGNAFDEDGLAA